MTNQPQAIRYRGATIFSALAEKLADQVKAAEFPKFTLRYRNDRAASKVGLEILPDTKWMEHFGKFNPLQNSFSQPLAMRYHGHQFRVYNPEIGDGRGFLFAQLYDDQNRLMDLGTKGSGTTPWSRSGDGRLTLKGAVRELLATEMLEALGVNTSQTFSIVETHEELWRNDEPSPTRSAVLVRLSHGHIRFGTFQRLAFEGDAETVAKLVRYCLTNYYPAVSHDLESKDDAECAALLFDNVATRMADLVASYMVAGFVHGVLNTDNMNISGESFDYGPWRFAQLWQPGFTAAYFDYQGLYCFGRQPEAFHWNLGQLGTVLRMICPAEPLVDTLNDFGARYQRALTESFCWRLGIKPKGAENDIELLKTAEQFLLTEAMTIDAFFFYSRIWMTGTNNAGLPEMTREQHHKQEQFAEMLATYSAATNLQHNYWQNEKPQSMSIEEVEEIWAAIDKDDNWQLLYDKITAVRTMGQALQS